MNGKRECFLCAGGGVCVLVRGEMAPFVFACLCGRVFPTSPPPQLCQQQSGGVLGLGGVSSSPAATATSLASIVGPAVCRPPGSAFMSIRHKQAVPKIRDVIKALFLHAAAVFNGLHVSGLPLVLVVGRRVCVCVCACVVCVCACVCRCMFAMHVGVILLHKTVYPSRQQHL